MKIRLSGTEHVGQALDFRSTDVTADRLVGAIRDSGDPFVESPPPTAVHEHVGHVHAGMTVDRRDAMVAAARSRGLVPPQQDEIEELNARIEAIAPQDPDLDAARRRLAAAGESVETLRERVARLSGRVEATREAGGDVTALQSQLRDATRELSEAETEAIAARQAMTSAEAAARAARDARATRLSLVDRRDNLERAARSWLAEAIAGHIERGVASLPVEPLHGRRIPEYSGSPIEIALVLARVARVRAPVVLEDSPFEHAARARAALDSPVVLVG